MPFLDWCDMKPLAEIDINCDMAEGTGNEAALMPYISSCNICCGAHAGGEQEITTCIDLALAHGVSLGAHPGFPDRAHFGRKEIHIPDAELRDTLIQQITKVKAEVERREARLTHVKPHGALYNMAAKSRQLSQLITDVIKQIDPSLILYGLANSETQQVARGNISFAAEGFADRHYENGHTLVSRQEGGLVSPDELPVHLEGLILKRKVQARTGLANINIQTLCIHGDGANAIPVAQKVYQLVRGWNIQPKPLVA